MRNTDYFRSKNITIAGIARSGLACANLLYDLGANVSLTDNQDSESTRQAKEKLKSKTIKVELGTHTLEFIKESDFLVISPGVSDKALPVVWAKEYGVPVISEIEVASILCPAPIVAITGTNGKTTVTTLIGRIIQASGKKAYSCGNIGNPFSAVVSDIRPEDFVSLEISSFQLEHIINFKPKVSVILNISRNHLDRYNNVAEYLEAKKRIYMNQDKGDYIVLNFDDPAIRDLSGEAKAKTVYFRKDKDLNPNQAAVSAVGEVLGIDKKLIAGVFKDFKGVEHRLEEVAESGGVKFINDSKATTVDATIWALKSISGPVILIAGGREKGNDYSVIAGLAKDKIKQAILIGESKDKIHRAFEGLFPIKETATLESALSAAILEAKPGDSVLFSPMCKSFDMFKDYEDRGRVFKRAVRELTQGLKTA